MLLPVLSTLTLWILSLSGPLEARAAVQVAAQEAPAPPAVPSAEGTPRFERTLRKVGGGDGGNAGKRRAAKNQEIEQWARAHGRQAGGAAQSSFEEDLATTLRGMRPFLVHVIVQRTVKAAPEHADPKDSNESKRTERPRSVTFATSGLLLDAKGTVVTVAEALAPSDRVVVRLLREGEVPVRKAILLGFDPSHRVGVLNVGPVPLEFRPQFAEAVVTVQPILCLSQSVGAEPSPSVGFLSGMVMQCALGETAKADLYRISEMDASARFGGVVTQLDGKIVGLIIPRVRASDAALPGVDFALPMGSVFQGVQRILQGLPRQVPDELSQELPRAWVGIRSTDPDPLLLLHLGLLGGMVVLEVFEDSPAQAAGVLSNDIVVSWNGNPVFSTDHFGSFVYAANPDEQVALEILRKGQRQTVSLTLCSR